MMADSHFTNSGSGEREVDPVARLELRPTIPTPPWTDGAWWPRSRNLAAELPALLAALADRVGTVALVGYHLDGWNQAERRLHIGAAVVELQGFTADAPQSVLVVGASGSRVTLVVVSPDAGDATASEALDEVSGSDGGPYARDGRANTATDDSLDELVARLARLGHRTDRRTEDISRWVHEAARQFIDAPVQAFVPILVEHIVRQKLGPADLSRSSVESGSAAKTPGADGTATGDK